VHEVLAKFMFTLAAIGMISTCRQIHLPKLASMPKGLHYQLPLVAAPTLAGASPLMVSMASSSLGRAILLTHFQKFAILCLLFLLFLSLTAPRVPIFFTVAQKEMEDAPIGMILWGKLEASLVLMWLLTIKAR
jgi:hypothetical protein